MGLLAEILVKFYPFAGHGAIVAFFSMMEDCEMGGKLAGEKMIL
jgi:hypothetical protein